MTLNANKIGTPVKIPNNIRYAIEKYREKMKLNRKQIAKEIGIGHSTYYSGVQHNNKVRPLQYEKILKYYNSTVLNKKDKLIVEKAEEEKITQIVAKGAIKIIKKKDEVIIEIA